MATKKRVKDDDGNEYEIEIDDDDDDDDVDEDDENIYFTEADLRWLKEQRKSAGSRSSDDKKKAQGVAIKKRTNGSNPKPKSRVKTLKIR